MCVQVRKHKLFKCLYALYEQVLLQTADFVHNSAGLSLTHC